MSNWLKQVDIEDGKRSGLAGDERKQLREANKWIRLLEQGNEVLRRAAAYLLQVNLPGKECSRSSARGLWAALP
ncbi:hypothetical protein [Leifsonia xyli]|uniref:hypothetical protein n=1 Tax=Leifsonia xyli TaxID=1575 RepID=UPI00114C9158|nr:hypothetical protein [Leifsonia xyli]